MAYPNYYNGGYFPQYQNGAVPDMLNQYKGQYQQMPMQQPVQQMPIQTPTPFIHTQSSGDTMLWVLNENEASSFPVAPNNSVVLWDKNNKTFYIKTANAQGIPSMQIYDFVERTAESSTTSEKHVCKCGDKYATKEQISALQGKIEGLEAKVEELSNPVVEKPKTTSKKAKESEE